MNKLKLYRFKSFINLSNRPFFFFSQPLETPHSNLSFKTLGHVLDHLFHKLAHEPIMRPKLIDRSISKLKHEEMDYYLSVFNGESPLPPENSLPSKLNFEEKELDLYKFHFGAILRSLTGNEEFIQQMFNHIEKLRTTLQIYGSDYYALGGEKSETILKICENMNRRVMETNHIVEIFRLYNSINKDVCFVHQQSYVLMALGGPIYLTKGMFESHKNLEITLDIFFTMKKFMVMAMRENNVSVEIIDRSLIRIERFRKDVLQLAEPEYKKLVDIGNVRETDKIQEKEIFDIIKNDNSFDHIFYDKSSQEKHFFWIMDYFTGKKQYTEADIRCAHLKSMIKESEFELYKEKIAEILRVKKIDEFVIRRLTWELEKFRTHIVYITNYNRIGGEQKINDISDNLVKKVYKNPKLDMYFGDLTPELLKEHHRQMFKFLLFGARGFTGKDLREAHRGLKMKPEYWDIFKNFIFESLVENKIDEETIKKCLENFDSKYEDVMYSYKPKIK